MRKILQRIKLNVYIQFRNLYTYIGENFFPLNLQYQKELSDFFQNKRVEAYEFHLMPNSIVRSTLGAWKILKNSIKRKVICIEIYLYLWSFLEFSH